MPEEPAGEVLLPTDPSSRPFLEPVVEVETVAGLLLAPESDRVIAATLKEARVWQPALSKFLLETLRPGDTFVDVGAQIGYFTVLGSRAVGGQGRVFAVEPETRNLDLLLRNLWRNGCTNASVVPLAAHSTTASMSLEIDEDNRGGHRLVDPGESPLSVRCVRLDDVLPSKVDVVKIDVQGLEREVIEGLEATLAANPGATVVVELSPTELNRRGLGVEPVVRWYESRSFEISLLSDDGQVKTVSASILRDLCSSADSPDLDLVLRSVPQSAHQPGLCPRKADGLGFGELDGELVVTDPGRNRSHVLNGTAAAVFELCTGSNEIEEITSIIQEAFALSDPPEREVEECLGHLFREHLII